VYHFNPDLASLAGLPAYYDDTVFLYDWARSWIMEAKLDDDGDLLALNPFLSDLPLARPIDMKIGPEGAMYLLEWGTGYGGDNDDARLVRLQYRRGGHAPVAVFDAAPTTGPVPLTVQFTGDDSFDSDPGDPIAFAWSFHGDETVDATEPNPSFTYTEPGNYTARLTVTDADGNKGVATVPITAGNTPPVLTFTRPVDGGIFDWGAQVPVEVAVQDNEDGTTPDGIACADLAVQPFIGHDSHSHPLDIYPLCEGFITTPEDDSATGCSLNAGATAGTGDANFNACIGKAYAKATKTAIPPNVAALVLPALATALNDANNDLNNENDCP
jgi:hypothetical protein